MSNLSKIISPDGNEGIVSNYISIEIKGIPVDLNIPLDLSNKTDLARIVHFFKEFGGKDGFENETIKIRYFQQIP